MAESGNSLSDSKLQSAAQAISAYGRSVADDVADGHDSLSSFVIDELEKRLDRFMAAIGALAKAGTPVEVAQIYTEHLIEMTRDNARQVVEMEQIIARAHTKAWSPFASVRTINGHEGLRDDQQG